MKLWLVNHYATTPAQAGRTRHFSLARELARRGHEVTVVAASFDHVMRRQLFAEPGKTWKSGTFNGVSFVWLLTPPYSGNTPARIWNMVVFAWRLWEGTGLRRAARPDVVIGSNPHLFAALAAERLAAGLRVPFVFEVRDLWPQSFVDLGILGRNHPMVRVFGWIERWLYRKAKRIISLLPGAAGHIAKRGADARMIAWIPNGVDLSMVPPPVPPEHDGVFTVIYAGAHGPPNALDSVLDAARMLQDEGFGRRVRFRMVGQGVEKERLCRRVRSENLRIVQFQEPVPKSQVFRLLQEADAFIVTLRRSCLYRHGMSLGKLYDYLAAARPVVFGVDSMNDPIAEAGAGISVPPEDARAMADAIKKLVAMSPGERWGMGLRGRRYVERHHDYSVLAGKLEEVLLEAVSGPGRLRSREVPGRRQGGRDRIRSVK